MRTKIIFTTILFNLVTISTCAYDFKQNGFYYNVNFTDMTAIVTFGEDDYKGKVTIPSSVTFNSKVLKVTEIGDGAFRNCERLTTLNIPYTILIVGRGACAGCTALRAVYMEDGVEIIKDAAFKNCFSLKELTLSNKLKEIGTQSFYGTLLPELKIPSSVVTIQREAFRCLDQRNMSLGPTSIKIEDSSEKLTIMSMGLGGSIGKKVLYLGRDIEMTDDFFSPAFSTTKQFEELEKLTIGNQVTDITELFHMSNCIKEICILNPSPISISNNCFVNSVYAGSILYVPDTSIADYQQEPGWNRFFNIQPLSNSSIKEISIPSKEIDIIYSLGGIERKLLKKGINIINKRLLFIKDK